MKTTASTILYVNDDTDDQDIFIEVLKEVHPTMECIVASNGLQALELLKQIKLPDCIYLDVNMPLMNGIELLKKIKENPSYTSVPVFILTTSKLLNTEEQARVLGASEYLIKPNSYQEYKDLLRSCFAAHLN